jgi:hypothetical protein
MTTRAKIAKGLAALVISATAAGVGFASDTETGQKIMEFAISDYAAHIAKYSAPLKVVGLTACAASIYASLYNVAKGSERRS